MSSKLPLYQAVLIVCVSFAVSGCSQVELASHYTKKLMFTPAKSQGAYKVGSPYKIAGKKYYPKENFYLVETGMASWYGPGFHGKKTANGERYDQYAMTAAHRTLQIPAIIKVTNLENNRSVILRVNDRGPYSSGRILDVSKAAAKKLGMIRKGTARIRLQVMTEESRKIALAAKSGKDTSNIKYRKVNHKKYKKTAYKQPVYLTNNATMGYEPIEKTVDSDLPESLRRPVMTTKQIKNQTSSYGENIDVPNWNRTVKNTNSNQVISKVNNIYVQAGAFSLYENANKLSKKLSRIAPVDINEISVKNKRFYRVRLGPVKTVKEAKLVKQNIREMGYLDPMSIVIEN